MLFRSIRPSATLEIVFEGQTLTVPVGISVMAGLLLHGIVESRTGLTGEARGPYCLIGTCFECRMVIDGEADRQACATPVRPGLTVARAESLADE